jgi:hypothetical protein
VEHKSSSVKSLNLSNPRDKGSKYFDVGGSMPMKMFDKVGIIKFDNVAYI